jgi:hypothetical protein
MMRWERIWKEAAVDNQGTIPTFIWWDRTESDASNNSIVACIRYRGAVFTEPLPSNDRGIHIQTYRHTDRWEGVLIRPLRLAHVPGCT